MQQPTALRDLMPAVSIPAYWQPLHWMSFIAKVCYVQAGEGGGTAPLLSAKLHKSWIADVQLLPAEGHNLHAALLPTLLTASNDGTVRLWDLGKCCDGMPLELAQADDLHTGQAPAYR